MNTEQVVHVSQSSPPPAPAAPEPDPPQTTSVVAAIPSMPPERKPNEANPPLEKSAPTSILVVDIGGTKIKVLASGKTRPRKAASGKDFTPEKLVSTVKELAHDWEYDALSIGYPGQAGIHGPRSEPGNLGSGWVGFDYATAFGKPVKLINDASMQALGSYEGGRMLFLGLGTGVGSTLIAGKVIIPLELGQLMYDKRRTLNHVLSRRGLERLGKNDWREAVHRVSSILMQAFIADYVVVGGGNAKHVKELPPGVRRGHNLTAFRGGVRLWSLDDIFVLASPGEQNQATADALEMKMAK